MWWIILIVYAIFATAILIGDDDFGDINSVLYEAFTEPVKGPLKCNSKYRIWNRTERIINVTLKVLYAIGVFIILYVSYSIFFIPYIADKIYDEFTYHIPNDLKPCPGTSEWKEKQEVKTCRKEYPETIHREIFLSTDIPFEPAADEIIYLENEYDEPHNKYIRENFVELSKLFEKKGFKFRYLPAIALYLSKNLTYDGEQISEYDINRKIGKLIYYVILKYLHNVGIVQYTDAYQDLYAVKLPRPCKCTPDNIRPSFIHYKCALDDDGEDYNCVEEIDGRSYYRFSYYELKPVKKGGATLHSQIVYYLTGLQKYDGVVRFRPIPTDEEREEEKNIKEEIKRQKEASVEAIANAVVSTFAFEKEQKQKDEFSGPKIVDRGSFDIEKERILLNELKKSIDKLLQIGVGNGVIISLLNTPDKLSRLVVTRNYRIILSDYNNAVIPMSPLPKALFILFLKHPEGIAFKNLSDYRDELTKIYMSISGRENLDDISKSIDSLVDPCSNSLNEKCSRIREAFMYRLSESIARNYFITGKRGETKVITLDRKLVIFR